MYEFAVHVRIRKGLGPEMFDKILYLGYDDVPDDVEISEMKQWAYKDAIAELRRSDDFHLYGENWIIGEILLT